MNSCTQLTFTAHQTVPPSIVATLLIQAQIKLPVIELPNFSGNACNWLHFRDTFEALIIKNKALSNIQRFHYLISSLKGKAKDLIINLQITNENFPVAWELVTQRYNNIKLIGMKHVKHLFQMPQIKKGDASSLRHLINHVTSHLNAIQALSLNASMQHLILNNLLLSTLHPETHKECELHRANQQDTPSATDVIAFLEARCKALALLQNNQSPRRNTAVPRYPPPAGTKVSNTSRCNLAKQIQCRACKEPHTPFKCNRFLKLQTKQRLTCAKQLGV
jgi:diphosphomevalonate decarboxylase